MSGTELGHHSPVSAWTANLTGDGVPERVPRGLRSVRILPDHQFLLDAGTWEVYAGTGSLPLMSRSEY